MWQMSFDYSVPEAYIIVLIGQVCVSTQDRVTFRTVVVEVFYCSRGSSQILKTVIN